MRSWLFGPSGPAVHLDLMSGGENTAGLCMTTSTAPVHILLEALRERVWVQLGGLPTCLLGLVRGKGEASNDTMSATGSTSMYASAACSCVWLM